MSYASVITPMDGSGSNAHCFQGICAKTQRDLADVRSGSPTILLDVCSSARVLTNGFFTQWNVCDKAEAGTTQSRIESIFFIYKYCWSLLYWYIVILLLLLFLLVVVAASIVIHAPAVILLAFERFCSHACVSGSWLRLPWLIDLASSKSHTECRWHLQSFLGSWCSSEDTAAKCEVSSHGRDG